MKLVSYLSEGHDRVAILVDGLLYDAEVLHPDLPQNMSMFLSYWEDAYSMALGGEMMIKEGKIPKSKGFAYDIATILTPVSYLLPRGRCFPSARGSSPPQPQGAHDSRI
jgi:fumarylacetoacetate (FAA) hydrolase